MSAGAAIYIGTLRHRRFRPRAHAFTYPVFQLLLDLDHLPRLASASRLFSLERFNWLHYRDRDYLPARTGATLKERLQADAEAVGHAWPGGRVLFLTTVRVLGHGFNPVSYAYCFDAQDRLRLICAEVTNTPWKERVTYWMNPSEGMVAREGAAWRFEVQKRLHVSPFHPMRLRYRWTFSPPAEHLQVGVVLFEDGVPIFDADLDLARHPFDAPTVRRTLLRFPLTTLKVVAAIHWEALKLWIKRVPIYPHPSKPTHRGSNQAS
jgi:DUF1365 family protein